MNIPTCIFAGDTVSWSEVLPEYPASEWTLKFALRGPSVHDVIATAGADGAHLCEIDKDASGDLLPGLYYVHAFVESATKRYTVSPAISLQVTDNIALAAASFDGRSENEKRLDEAQSVLDARIKGGAVDRYTIGRLSAGGRELVRTPIADLRAYIAELGTRVALERRQNLISGGRPDPFTHYASF